MPYYLRRFPTKLQRARFIRQTRRRLYELFCDMLKASLVIFPIEVAYYNNQFSDFEGILVGLFIISAVLFRNLIIQLINNIVRLQQLTLGIDQSIAKSAYGKSLRVNREETPKGIQLLFEIIPTSSVIIWLYVLITKIMWRWDMPLWY